jgi:lysozyme family protein
MKQLPLETAQQIAYKVYWLPLKLDSFDPRVAFQILDTNYNGGKCVLWMQGASGAKVDGVLGPQTIQAVQSFDPLKFILRWNSLRIRYYTSLAKWVNFGKGWANRVATNLWKGAQ